jgi:hypothetical protein
MDESLDALARELTALTERFVDLGAKLSDAARALEEAGAPPGEGLVSDLSGARTQFLQLRLDVLSAARAASVLPMEEPESLTDLEPLLGAIQDAIRLQTRRADFEQMRERVVATLDRILEIVHRDDPAFAALVGCQDLAHALRESTLGLTDPDAPEAQRLGADAEAFADLLMMVESRDALDDERYAQLEETVSRAFGRGLAVAVARGRLGFAGDVLEPPAVPAPEPEPQAQPEAIAVPVLDAPPVLAAPPMEPPPLELEIAAPPLPPERAIIALEATIEMPSADMPALELETPAGLAAVPVPAEPEVAPVAAAAPPAPAEPAEAEAAVDVGPDETAQWWLAAWARWSGWKATHDVVSVVREEIGKYPYLLSVPIQKSPDYDDGLLAYGYSILVDHVEKQNPGCVGNALNSLKPDQARPLGDQLYDYLVAEGRLEATYPEFVKNALLAAVPEPGVWFQFRILESKEDTRIFQRPSARLGETELAGQRLASDGQRYAEHKFKMTLPPLTTRFVQVSAESIRESRGVGVRIVSEGAACDSGWIVSVPAGSKGKPEARRIVEDGTHVPGLGKELSALWIGVFNPDPHANRRYELSVFLRKDTKSPFRGRG